jgi:hypothetical protein
MPFFGTPGQVNLLHGFGAYQLPRIISCRTPWKCC